MYLQLRIETTAFSANLFQAKLLAELYKVKLASDVSIIKLFFLRQ